MEIVVIMQYLHPVLIVLALKRWETQPGVSEHRIQAQAPGFSTAIHSQKRLVGFPLIGFLAIKLHPCNSTINVRN